MSDVVDNDPRWIAAVIDREEQYANELRTRALENQARAITGLSRFIDLRTAARAVTMGDLSLLAEAELDQAAPSDEDILIP